MVLAAVRAVTMRSPARRPRRLCGKSSSDEQERGGEHARVVLKDPGRVAEAAGESRVRTGRSGQRRVDERESDPERGQADDRARAERRTQTCCGLGVSSVATMR